LIDSGFPAHPDLALQSHPETRRHCSLSGVNRRTLNGAGERTFHMAEERRHRAFAAESRAVYVYIWTFVEGSVRFEPAYHYLYMQYANYLLPKWHGHPVDASSFARMSADAVGGNDDDILYFQIATNLITHGDDDFAGTKWTGSASSAATRHSPRNMVRPVAQRMNWLLWPEIPGRRGRPAAVRAHRRKLGAPLDLRHEG
jgi:hypothetical protein